VAVEYGWSGRQDYWLHSGVTTPKKASFHARCRVPLFLEYEAIIARPETQRRCPLTAAEQIRLFDAFLSRTQLIEVYYRWRPNLPDEGDNHVFELAVAAGDAPIVTYNRRDFRGGELRFPSIVVQSPAAWLKSQGL
jgi:predicted nucleic acid-binding protein